MTSKVKNVDYEKRAKVLFISLVIFIMATILTGLGWYSYYLRNTTFISELQAVGPSGDEVVEDYDGRLYYVLSSEGKPVSAVYNFTAQFACFEGEKGKMWTSDVTQNDVDEVLQLYRSIVKVRGREVKDWSSDKITYPIYSVKFNLREPSTSKSFCGVWSNGYFITSAGKVYKCNYDFAKFETAGDTVFSYSEVERDGEHRMLWPLTQFEKTSS